MGLFGIFAGKVETREVVREVVKEVVKEVVREVEVERVEYRDRLILGSPEEVTVYEAYYLKVQRPVLVEYGFLMSFRQPPDEEEVAGLFATCELALSRNPGCSVRAKTMWRIGNTYLTDLQVTKVVTPVKEDPKGKLKTSAK